MGSTNIQNLVVEFGTEAVKLYQEMSGENADAMPEVFLGGFIAQRLFERLACPVHIERSYEKMARQLGIPITHEFIHEMGSRRADVAIYQGQVPSHIVEFKKFSEGNPAEGVLDDLNKARRLAGSKPVDVLLGVLVCPLSNSELDARIESLYRALGADVLHQESPAYPSKDGKWQWCFGCYEWSATKSKTAEHA